MRIRLEMLRPGAPMRERQRAAPKRAPIHSAAQLVETGYLRLRDYTPERLNSDTLRRKRR